MEKTDDLYLNRFECSTESDHLNSCCGSDGNRKQVIGSGYEHKYHCLMKCEGSKTYHQSGYCPDCNMKLVSVDGNNHH